MVHNNIKILQNNQTTLENRISWIDIAKCIGILAIVLGHASTGPLNNITFSFNSVIFFILSGMTFCRTRAEYNNKFCFNNKLYKDFFKSLFTRILIPYLSWGLISIFIYALLGNLVTSTLELSQSHFAVLPNIGGLLYGNSESGYFEWNRPLWFLPALVLIEIMWFIILKVIFHMKNDKKVKIIYSSCMIFSLLWIFIETFFNWNLILPFELETSLSMFFFFGIGILIRSTDWNKKKLINKINTKIGNFISIIIGCSLTIILAIYNGGTDTRADYFSNVYIYILNAIIASTTVILLSRVIKTNRIMEYIGKRTLAILVMHKFPIMFIKTIFPGINTMIFDGNIIIPIILSLVTIILCLIVEKIANLIIPEILGNSR